MRAASSVPRLAAGDSVLIDDLGGGTVEQVRNDGSRVTIRMGDGVPLNISTAYVRRIHRENKP